MHSLWMLFASFVFSIMGLCVKLASELYSTSEIVMFRGLIGAIALAAWIVIRGGTFRTAYGWDHLIRGAIGVTALWLWFYAIASLPLATAMTLNYMSPIWMAAIVFAAGWLTGSERFEWGVSTAILTSFIGVTLLLQPAFQSSQWFAGLVGLMSGALAALAYLMVKRLGQQGEPEYRIVFYFSLIGAISGLMGTLFWAKDTVSLWRSHSGHGILLLIGIGISATVAQVALTRAYRLGKTLVTANLQYTGIVFSSFWGMMIWGDMLGWKAWIGIALILASGSAATFYNARKIRIGGKLPRSETAAPVR
jgi:S-adenosylmethionine uptake transporter